MKPYPADPAIPLAALLVQLGAEATVLAREVEGLQTLIGDVLLASTADVERLVPLQTLDHLFQHLCALGAVLNRTAGQADEDWRVDGGEILLGVSLSDLTRRLAGSPCAATDAAGDLELW